MKILHLHTELNIACGISKTIYLLIQNIPNDYKQFIYTFGGDGLAKFEQTNAEVRVTSARRKGIVSFLVVLIELIYLSRKNKIDILHSHHRYFDLIAYIMSKFTKVKTITSVHSKVDGKKILSYKADQLIACSYTIKAHLIEYFHIDEKRITVIHNFVDEKESEGYKIQSDLKELIVGSQNKTVIGFVGRINVEEKGVDVLLESFKLLSKKLKDIKLLIVGNGPDSTFVRNYACRNKLDVAFVEAQENVYPFLHIMDIIVMPSRVEPFGIVAIEAGLNKKPVVCSNVDGLIEIVEDGVTGLLVMPNDSTLLADTIFRLVENKNLRTELGEALYKKVRANFTVTKCIPQYLAVYNNVGR